MGKHKAVERSRVGRSINGVVGDRAASGSSGVSGGGFSAQRGGATTASTGRCILPQAYRIGGFNGLGAALRCGSTNSCRIRCLALASGDEGNESTLERDGWAIS